MPLRHTSLVTIARTRYRTPHEARTHAYSKIADRAVRRGLFQEQASKSHVWLMMIAGPTILHPSNACIEPGVEKQGEHQLCVRIAQSGSSERSPPCQWMWRSSDPRKLIILNIHPMSK
jgi:hypothetical protein